MEPFTTLTGIVAPIDRVNVNTDEITPARFLKTIRRSGFENALFANWRFTDAAGTIPNPDFVLNQPRYQGATIMLAGDNFGCGSSREHAPWALRDYGFRCIIAPSFADIFYNNTIKNGMLPIRLAEQRVNELLRLLLELPGAEISVDLEAQTVTGPDEQVDHFAFGEFAKHCLLAGLDEIGLTEAKEDKIRS